MTPKNIVVVHKGGISGGYACDVVNGEGGNGGIGTVETKTLTISNYVKLVEFVKSIANNFNLFGNQEDFINFFVRKEHQACELLEEIGEL